MKTIFGLIIEFGNENFFNRQKSLYDKISKTFDEFYIINLNHFSLFKKKKRITMII